MNAREIRNEMFEKFEDVMFNMELTEEDSICYDLLAENNYTQEVEDMLDLSLEYLNKSFSLFYDAMMKLDD